MHNIEIRQKIDLNNKMMKDLMSPDAFTLNNVVADLIAENRELQKKCKHDFIDGFCIYCDISEDANV